MKLLTKLYYRLFPTYKERDVQLVSYTEADRLMTGDNEWELSQLEDDNGIFAKVWICKKTRINF